MPDPGFPVTITDDDGECYRCVAVTLDAGQREAFAQAWVAACHEADRMAVSSHG